MFSGLISGFLKSLGSPLEIPERPIVSTTVSFGEEKVYKTLHYGEQKFNYKDNLLASTHTHTHTHNKAQDTRGDWVCYGPVIITP